MCFTDLIGISRAFDDTSDSGYYLDDLDITTKDADSGHTMIDGSGRDLLSRKRDFAEKILFDVVREKMRKNFRVGSTLFDGVIGNYKRDLPSFAADATKYRGIRIRVDYAPYVKLSITRASLMLQSSGSQTIRVFDLQQNKQIDSFTITSVADEVVSVDLLKSYQTYKQRLDLLFVYDGTSGGYETPISKGGCRSCEYNNRYLYASGVEIGQSADKIANNIDSSGGGTGGLSLTYNMECDIEAFVCSMRNIIAHPLLYLWGAKVAESFGQSDRFNSKVRLPQTDWQDLHDRWMNQFERLLEGIFENWQAPNDECFACKGGIEKRIMIP